MRALHFSRTPLAGAPIRLVQALRSLPDIHVNLIDKEKWGLYDHDIVFSDSLEQSFDLAMKADIIHLHNYLDLDSKDFHPIDFNLLKKRGKAFVRQFHSHPSFIANEMKVSVNSLLNSEMPSLVVAQFQERFYPNAHVVPNIIPQGSNLYSPSSLPVKYDVFFAPTSSNSAWDDRWNTKGALETLILLNELKGKRNFFTPTSDLIPLNLLLQEKARSLIVIDELITGSYHLSGLEGLSLGKAVLCFVDSRALYVMREISGSDIIPFVNIRLEDTFEVISYLLDQPSAAVDIGRTSREWIEKYWADSVLAKRYADVYDKLLANPELIKRQKSLRVDSSVLIFNSITLPDLIYKRRAFLFSSNKSQRFTSINFFIRILRKFRSIVSKGVWHKMKVTVQKVCCRFV